MNYTIIILNKGYALMIANIVKRLSVGQIELSGELIYQRYYIFENITNVIIHTHDSYFHKINHFF